ncbi:MAG: 50S ribosomal protein L23 [Flavobacteriales bacterium]|jgi:large subunit ribosomal protein L23|nr:MAG: 50S ribosomal protein L23 [Flavobacteriales bacterium]
MSVLVKPIITEKATEDAEVRNRYAFHVKKDANKLEIKQAIEAFYGVHVENVRTMIVAPKPKSRFTKSGIISGKTAPYKKAIVEVRSGETIDFFNNI